MKYFAGIDGGQSSTIAVVGAEDGRVLGRGVVGPADEIGATPESTRLRDALRDALERACDDANLERNTHFVAIVAGVSGYEGRVYGQPPVLPAERFMLMHDTKIAHAGALGGASGVVVIAGTGSVAYIVDDDGCTVTEGGLGYVFGDEGSAFWIAKEAIRGAAGCREGNACAVTTIAKAYFGYGAPRDVIAAFYHGEISRERFAGFAEHLISADTDDACVREIVDAAGEHLARLAALATESRWHWQDRPRAAFVGGLMQAPRLRANVYHETRQRGLSVGEPRFEPAVGALLLAYRGAAPLVTPNLSKGGNTI